MIKQIKLLLLKPRIRFLNKNDKKSKHLHIIVYIFIVSDTFIYVIIGNYIIYSN